MYIRIDHAGLRRLSQDLRRARQTDRNRELAKAFRKELRPLVPEVRAAIRATPSKGMRRSRVSVAERPLGLREAMARGVVVKVGLSGRNATAAIRIASRHFPRGSKGLAAYREGATRPHRARNWGRDDWHGQPAHPAFFPTIQPRIPQISQRITVEVTTAVERAVREGFI